MMEISKTLQKEILSVQNKLKNAIRDHQICVGKLKDDPNNADVLGQIQEIQRHIVSLGRCQKQVVQRLRKEVEALKAENANGAKASVAALLRLNNNNNNNNNHITLDNEEERDIVQVKVQSNGVSDSRRSSEEDCVEVIQNGSARELISRAKSVETVSGDEDVVELSNDEDSCEKEDEKPKINLLTDECKSDPMQVNFLGNLGLITSSKFSEVQNKKAERKRRSTANPQFEYSNWEIPTKRKRHSYLQSAGSAPQTRQTTARLNGPSPPPTKGSTKSTSPPTKSTAKSISSAQKPVGRPNILRNMQEGPQRVSSTKIKQENGVNPLQKTSQSKSVHIPGLPSSLTIERVDNATSVCIYCRSPGTLTFCDDCSTSYHASCRSSSPPPMKLCKKCAENSKDDECLTPVMKKDNELAAASYAPGVAGKAGEDPEVDQASSGLHKVDATSPGSLSSGHTSTQQLPPACSYFISLPGQTDVTPAPSEQPQSQPITFNSLSSHTFVSGTSGSTVAYSPLIVNHQFSVQPSLIPFIQPDTQLAYNYTLPIVSAQEKPQQSYLIVKNISDPCVGGIVSYNQQQQLQPSNPYDLSNFDFRERPVSQEFAQSTPLVHDHLTSDCQSKPAVRRSKKPTTRAVPGLRPVSFPENSSFSNNSSDKFDHVEPSTSSAPEERGQLDVRRTSESSDTKLPLHNESQNQKSQDNSKTTEQLDRCQILHSMLTGDNQPNIVANCSDESGARGDSLRTGSITDRLFQRLTEGQKRLPRSGQSVSQIGEHVKLEEAHLSAPSSANIVQEDITSKEKSKRRSKSNASSAAGTDQNPCEVNLNLKEEEQKVVSKSSKENSENSKESLPLRILDSKSKATGWKGTDGWISKRKKKNRRKPQAVGNDKEIHQQVTDVSDADTLTATEGEDEETESDDGADITPTIDMQVLEDFESAMMEVARDETANLK